MNQRKGSLVDPYSSRDQGDLGMIRLLSVGPILEVLKGSFLASTDLKKCQFLHQKADRKSYLNEHDEVRKMV